MKFYKQSSFIFPVMFICILSLAGFLFYKKRILESLEPSLSTIAYDNNNTVQCINYHLANEKNNQTKLNTIANKLKIYKGIIQNPVNYLTINSLYNNDDNDFKGTITSDVGTQKITISYPMGEQGETGEKGIVGVQGILGKNGPRGPQGMQGTSMQPMSF